MIRHSILFYVLTLFTVGCGSQFEHPDEYQVISNILQHALNSEPYISGSKLILVAKKDGSFQTAERLGESGYKNVQESTILDYNTKNYNTKNKKRTKWEKSKFAKGLDFEIIDKDEFRIGSDIDWMKLREEFGEHFMLVSFSSVGFSDDGQQALVSSWLYGGIDGSGGATLLNWNGDKWIPQAPELTEEIK